MQDHCKEALPSNASSMELKLQQTATIGGLKFLFRPIHCFIIFFTIVAKMFTMICDYKRKQKQTEMELKKPKEEDLSKGKFFEMLKSSAKKPEKEYEME
jgi:hypothetical protein